jgi:signal peptidase I
LTATTLKRLWKNEYFKTAVMIIFVVAIFFGFWFGSQVVLRTPYPALAVASGSMCLLPGSYCDGWSHPFEPTLHVGDLIIVQGVNPEEIKAASYPDGDIIVFHQPYADGELIVHRAVAKKEKDGKWYFQTKGDGNKGPDSSTPNIPEDNVVGKVVLRIPWVGHISLLMNNSFGILIIALLLIILIIAEFIVPALSSEKAEAEQKEDVQEAFGEPKAL